MDVIKTMAPGTPGTIRYYEKWADKLVNVRYRRDDTNKRILTTVEIVVDTRPMDRDARKGLYLPLKIGFTELKLRRLIKEHNGQWDRSQKAWYLPHKVVRKLGLEHKVVLGLNAPSIHEL
ncbi:hypothetical protein [Teredinibacter purpureus]|uniref:hypothetical protein n=1 Tax=Teredinibacter purpureus TaxID=2731756 RepID=UPI0005F7E59A|nr:hypothetical protein [Teredinibacter purpureus]